MDSRRARLDRFISAQTGVNRRDVRLMLAQQRILVDGVPATSIQQVIDQFSHVVLDSCVLQANEPSYVMMNKPIGIISATKD